MALPSRGWQRTDLLAMQKELSTQTHPLNPAAAWCLPLGLPARSPHEHRSHL